MAAVAAIIAIGAGATMEGVGRVRAGRAQNRINQVNAASAEKIGEQNAAFIEQGSEENAQILEFNARMKEALAIDAIARGKETELRYRTEVKGFIGSQRSAYAGQGVDIGDGSALEVQMDTAHQGELDALLIGLNSAREAWGYKVEAQDQRNQAGAIRRLGKVEAKNTRDVARANAMSLRLGGNAAQQAGNLGGASSILSGAGTILVGRYGFGGKGGKSSGKTETFSY